MASYTFSGTTTGTGSGNTCSVTLNIGSTTNPFVVVGITVNGVTTVSPTLTVGGQSAILVTNDTSDETFIWYVQTSGGLSGNQTITFNAGTSIGSVHIGYALWYIDNATVTPGNNVQFTGTSSSLSVTANQFMFAMLASTGAINLASSTQVPTNSNQISGYTDLTANQADWTVSSTGTFTISNATGGSAVFASAGAFTATSTGSSPRIVSKILM